ncbi:MAG: hypothetical protein QGG36_14045 [Pirellulaceae bacterium]|nr:hypothetical protein [Pirellulaceae bacterium]MDP7016921.1 hypothetical protein [Pirellulaceae bacterium]
MSRYLICALISLVLATTAVAEQPGLTFFGWSDQHVKTNGDVNHLLAAIDGMNELPGSSFPTRIGGEVAKPAFVFGCGDVTEWPTHAAVRGYSKVISERLKFPSYDVMGNHDDGGKAPSETMKKWLIERHGGLTYAFDKGGVRFIGLFSQFDANANNPAQPLTKKALGELRKRLAKTPAGTPVVVATHLCFDAMTNRDELVETIGDANVILILGGHYHKATVHRHKGRNFVQLPSPRDQDEFTVLRITKDRLTAIPYDHVKKEWTSDRGKILDMRIRGPVEEEKR